MRFAKIGLALAFSPRMKALLAETARLRKIWGAELVLIHVGNHTQQEEALLTVLLNAVGLADQEVKVLWRSGKPSEQILLACKNEKVDLLVAGALRKENLMQYYLGTIARKILRKADCSVLMFIDPTTDPQPIKNIVVNAEDSPYVKEAIASACEFGKMDRASWLHIVKEIKLYSLTMSAADQRTEDEYENFRNSLVKEEIENVEKMLQKIPHEGLKVNIKLVSGKSGFELSKFAQRKHADLLVVGASPRRFSLFDRVFPHDLEYIFADLPCNLLIVQPRKEVANG
ncbi:MAG: universal stress protein [Cyclobacteriaceae bacterium]|nr:universal stress protein [Cyclobacteriaceae bacterium]